MDDPHVIPVELIDDTAWNDAERWAGAFLASFGSVQTRRAYRGDLRCWFTYCTAHNLHPYRGVRRTHLEIYLRDLEQHQPTPSHATLYRRIATLSSWYRWLEDEDIHAGNPTHASADPHATPAPNHG